MPFEEIRNEVLELDPKIRHISIFDGAELYKSMQKDVTSYLGEKETEKSLRHAILRWKNRLTLSHKLGDPCYALTRYKKVFRVSIPYGNEGLILLSTEIDANIMTIMNEVFKISAKYGIMLTH